MRQNERERETFNEMLENRILENLTVAPLLRIQEDVTTSFGSFMVVGILLTPSELDGKAPRRP